MYPQIFIAVYYNFAFLYKIYLTLMFTFEISCTKRKIPYPLNRNPKDTARIEEKREYVRETGREMCQLRLFQAILIKIKFYHRNMGTGHRADIVRTALHMRRISKQKLIKQYKKIIKKYYIRIL